MLFFPKTLWGRIPRTSSSNMRKRGIFFNWWKPSGILLLLVQDVAQYIVIQIRLICCRKVQHTAVKMKYHLGFALLHIDLNHSELNCSYLEILDQAILVETYDQSFYF